VGQGFATAAAGGWVSKRALLLLEFEDAREGGVQRSTAEKLHAPPHPSTLPQDHCVREQLRLPVPLRERGGGDSEQRAARGEQGVISHLSLQRADQPIHQASVSYEAKPDHQLTISAVLCPSLDQPWLLCHTAAAGGCGCLVR